MDPNAPSLPPHPPSGPGKDIDETALDWHATILHLLGFDYEKLTYRFGGRNMRLTDLCGEVVRDVLVLMKHILAITTSIRVLLCSAVLLAGLRSGRGADEYGSFYLQQSLVHFILPENGRHGVSVIMVPGHNLSSSIYLSTPDGRPGWAQEFADDGFDVYVINDPDFDFSRGFGIAPFTSVPTLGAPPADPAATLAWQQDIWRRWGFGSPAGNPYPDTRFPTASFAVFDSHYPYVSSTVRSYPDAVTALLDMVGPSLLLAHSAGGPTAVSAAKARSQLVPALILIEPTNPPDADDFPVLAGKSLFGVYGDYIDSRNQGNRKLATEAAAALFSQNGGHGEVISLPEDLGIFGNTHLLMQDNNSAFIADLILDWLAVNVDTNAMPPQIEIAIEGTQIRLSSRVEGIWQSSTDLVIWTNISPTPSREVLVPLSGSAMFFRQLD